MVQAMTIGFIYNVGMGTSQLYIWDEDSQTLTFKDSEFSDGCTDTPPPDCILMQSAENV